MRDFLNPYINLNYLNRKILGFASVSLFLLTWSVISLFELVEPNKLPSPWKVVMAMGYLLWNDGQSMLLNATMWSVGRIFIAGVLVILIGLPFGIIMGSSPKMNAFFSPFVDPFRSAPIVAILPILVMWLGIGEGMKITFLFLGAVIYLIPMVRDAIISVPQSYWISAKDLGATPVECITRSVVPIAMPRIADAIVIAFSVMWTYITVAEYVNAKSGLGQLIQNARRFSAWDQVFAGIIVIIFLALCSYQGMQYIKKKLYPWETQI